MTLDHRYQLAHDRAVAVALVGQRVQFAHEHGYPWAKTYRVTAAVDGLVELDDRSGGQFAPHLFVVVDNGR